MVGAPTSSGLAKDYLQAHPAARSLVQVAADLSRELSAEEREALALAVSDGASGPLSADEVGSASSLAAGLRRERMASPARYLAGRRLDHGRKRHGDEDMAAWEISDGTALEGPKSFVRRLFGSMRGTKPLTLSPPAAGRLGQTEFAVAEFLGGLDRAALDDMLAAVPGATIARNHKRAEGEASISVVQRTTKARSGDTKDKVRPRRGHAALRAIHAHRPLSSAPKCPFTSIT